VVFDGARAGNCGYCYPCMIRRAALHAAGIDSPSGYPYDIAADANLIESTTKGASPRALVRALSVEPGRSDVLPSGRPRGRSRSPRRQRATTRGRGDGAEVEAKIAHRTAAGSAARWAPGGAHDSRAPALKIHGFPPGSTSRRGIEPWTLRAVSRRPSHRSPIRKWLGEPPGIGPNRRVFGSGPSGAETRQFAGTKRPTTPNQVLFAMQKVVGSSPISRLEVPANRRFSRIACRLRSTQIVEGSIAVCRSR
jgi:hypothetical protein